MSVLRVLTCDGSLSSTIRCPTYNSFCHLCLAFYFHLSFTDGRKVHSLYHPASLWELFTVEVQFLRVSILWYPCVCANSLWKQLIIGAIVQIYSLSCHQAESQTQIISHHENTKNRSSPTFNPFHRTINASPTSQTRYLLNASPVDTTRSTNCDSLFISYHTISIKWLALLHVVQSTA